MSDASPAAKILHNTIKRKVALVGGYVGTGYYGLQMDPNKLNTPNFLPTIENEYRMALTKAGYILESNSELLSRIDWARSSRTDKGVHAARIVFSCKLELQPEWVEGVAESTKEPSRLAEIVKNTNAHLPENIRLFGCIRVPSAFKAQDYGKWRAYEYLLPLSLLSEKPVHRSDADMLLKRFNDQLKQFEGSQSFHNFHRLAPKELKFSKKHRKPKETNGDQGESVPHVNLNDNRDTSNNSDSNGAKVDPMPKSATVPKLDIKSVDDLIHLSMGGNISEEVSVTLKGMEKTPLDFDEESEDHIASSEPRPDVYQEWQANPREVGGRTLNSIYMCRAELLPNNGDEDSVPMVKVHIIGHFFILQ